MICKNSLLRRTWPMVIQCAETHRKPRWVPVAKSKIYRIPKRPEVSEDEKLELLRINNNYKTQMRAIRRFYHEEMIKEMSSLQSASSEMSQKVEAEEWARCIELNNKWNEKVALEREQRRMKEIAIMEEDALTRMAEKDQLLQTKIDKASEEIKKQKELSKFFITPETLEAAIDQAIANPTDYNYAIDLHGNKIEGRDMQPTFNKEQKSASA